MSGIRRIAFVQFHPPPAGVVATRLLRTERRILCCPRYMGCTYLFAAALFLAGPSAPVHGQDANRDVVHARSDVKARRSSPSGDCAIHFMHGHCNGFDRYVLCAPLLHRSRRVRSPDRYKCTRESLTRSMFVCRGTMLFFVTMCADGNLCCGETSVRNTTLRMSNEQG